MDRGLPDVLHQLQDVRTGLLVKHGAERHPQDADTLRSSGGMVERAERRMAAQMAGDISIFPMLSNDPPASTCARASL